MVFNQFQIYPENSMALRLDYRQELTPIAESRRRDVFYKSYALGLMEVVKKMASRPGGRAIKITEDKITMHDGGKYWVLFLKTSV